ncbi:ERV/ALR sulfhydryl oxidase domain-containing protein [Sparassis latifolia]|uniref:Sulfhydryl oxidase n=1 Tax=Sparassis crispa TaxID=139825 RepID=A0A401GZH3_9APHY|nr:Mitochondrial FAD-linked sulfhydryl oxidase ERV1 [Sparassis crispa]GBE87563.1 Mitochondrial FAD-linked sulfhydryl oxidase ERV1 [Sparassis crispa]
MSDKDSESNPTPQQPLPPGMVLGPDGKPCKICTAFRYWKPRKQNSSKAPSHDGRNSTTSMMAAMATGQSLASQSEPEPEPETRPEYCPPDVEQLGRATWTFLHTTAAYYPERPTPTQRANMLMLLRSLPILYPCTYCASHLDTNMQDNPPNVSGRVALSRWLCERHNDVNVRLGKDKFDCSIEKTDERWKDGPADGSCD